VWFTSTTHCGLRFAYADVTALDQFHQHSSNMAAYNGEFSILYSSATAAIDCEKSRVSPAADDRCLRGAQAFESVL
jgi:hypothetical protein